MKKLEIRIRKSLWVTLVALLLAPAASWADGGQSLRIVLTNDDGFETENIQALFSALVDAGQARVHELHGRELALAHEARELDGGQEAGVVGHGALRGGRPRARRIARARGAGA